MAQTAKVLVFELMEASVAEAHSVIPVQQAKMDWVLIWGLVAGTTAA